MRTTALGGLVLLLALPAGAEADPAVEAARKRLERGKVEERLGAAEELEKFGKNEDAEKALIRALDDPDWGVGIRAARALGVVGDEPARRALVRLAVEGEIQWLRDAATEALRALGAEDAAARLLHQARATKDEERKARALRAIRALGAGDLLLSVRDFLHAREDTTIAEAARALGVLGRAPERREQAMKDLRRLLRDRGERSAFYSYAAAVEGLGEIEDPEARRLVVAEILAQPDEDPYVALRAIRALARQPAEGVAVTVVEALEDAKTPDAQRRAARLCGALGVAATRERLEVLAASNRAPVRSEAVRALGLIGVASSGPALIRALDDREERVRVEAVTALAGCLPRAEFRALAERMAKDPFPEARLQFVVEVNDQGDPAGIPALVPFLDDADWRPASAAIAAVGTLGIADDLPLLAPKVSHSDWRIRGAALEGIGRLRAAAAIPILAKALDDRDPLVRGVALANLQILSGQRLGTRPDRWNAWWEEKGSGLVLVKRSRRTAEEKAAEAGERREARYAHEFDRWRDRAIEVLQKARILVTIGAWDRVERVLEHLRIPHTVVRAQEIKETGLNPNQVLLVNCEGTQDRHGRERIRWFVNCGGYLMTTDWALLNTVETCFPGYLRRYENFFTGNDVVVVEEAQPGHPWTRGIFDEVPALKWWLEIQAFPMVVSYPERVDVLVDSAEMRRKYGASPMAATFRFGLGRVQHSVSHFFLQEEGMTQRIDPRERMVYAADHLGIPLTEIRRLAESGQWAGTMNEDTIREIAPHYSMFRLIVNVIEDKEAWVEGL